MAKNKKVNTQEKLLKIQEESQKQALPEQKRVFTVSEKIRRRVHNLPDPTRPPLGYDEHKAFDRVFPYIRLPRLRPPNHGDTVIFNAPELAPNQLILGDNLEVLRTIPSETIDLIYIDPPFFSGRNYNVIWGDSNEVRSFYDIWEGGIDTYLIWLNARLWEMRRVLTKTGSIYVHCDWHASHYIKSEMDKIFGYENFRNGIVWKRATPIGGKVKSKMMPRDYDTILYYCKSQKAPYKNQFLSYSDQYINVYFKHVDKQGRRYRIQTLGDYSEDSREQFRKQGKIYKSRDGKEALIQYLDESHGVLLDDIWIDIIGIQHKAFQKQASSEKIGYPTQKPEALLERIIKASSNEGDVVADFFCGGGTTLTVAVKLNRRFIGCDSSRVAISVTFDRLVKIGEEMSGVKSNISPVIPRTKLFGEEQMQMKMQAKGVSERVPNIEISYLGVYPIDKFTYLDHNSFIDFVLACYGANHNTAEGITSGFRPPGQEEPILVGPANPNDSADAKTVKAFFDEIKARLEPNKLVRAKIIGWRFNRQVIEYVKILRKYIEDNQLPVEIDLVALDSREFRQRILQRYQDFDEAEFYLRFSKPPVISDIKIKKVSSLEYEFEAVDAFSSNEDGYLVNCQWDFDYQEGHFAADKDYILSRQKVKPKGREERFEAILSAKHIFEKEGEYTIACKVQDNLAGETILAKKIKLTE